MVYQPGADADDPLTAQNIGGVEQRGASFSRGLFYGIVLQHFESDAAQGANLTQPVPEVTAAPDYR